MTKFIIVFALVFSGCLAKSSGVTIKQTHNCYDVNSNVDPYMDYSQFKNSPCDRRYDGPRSKSNMRKNNPAMGSTSGSIVQTYYVDKVY